MSTLRKLLRHPGTYLGMMAFALVFLVADGLRAPERQLAARVYVAAVHGYQHSASPLLGGIVRCRFRPTCSHYSVEAVRKYGLARGLRLTAARLWRCRGGVPLATADAVP